MRPAYAVRIAVRSPGAVLVVHVVDEQLIERLAGFEAEQDCMPMRDRLLQDGQSGPRCCAPDTTARSCRPWLSPRDCGRRVRRPFPRLRVR